MPRPVHWWCPENSREIVTFFMELWELVNPLFFISLAAYITFNGHATDIENMQTFQNTPYEEESLICDTIFLKSTLTCQKRKEENIN